MNFSLKYFTKYYFNFIYIFYLEKKGKKKKQVMKFFLIHVTFLVSKYFGRRKLSHLAIVDFP